MRSAGIAAANSPKGTLAPLPLVAYSPLTPQRLCWTSY
ncbi:hypothetical protein Hsw_0153 [Hymenobacter swuensis DY53]|uniref:Uncharacterized protein n=1 Tax=Hymenobacter swuensis DY53 TaxID=1227739 RepID=W8ET74_9BACT|nr:hypothetical protein Hsw_0153 [Hymenobacter swuensis DY53]